MLIEYTKLFQYILHFNSQCKLKYIARLYRFETEDVHSICMLMRVCGSFSNKLGLLQSGVFSFYKHLQYE